MKNIFKVSILFLLLIGTSSCVMDGVKGDGNVVMKKRKISNVFSKVVVSRGLDVYITKSKDIGSSHNPAGLNKYEGMQDPTIHSG